jgi:hypothetical protein
MCIFPSAASPSKPQLPVEPAQMKQPDSRDAAEAGSKAADQLRARANTILTSGSGVTETAPTGKKTLLGQ